MVLSCVVAACGGGGGGGGGTTTTPPPATTSGTVAGVAGKGLLLNAVVNFYAVTNGAASTTALTTPLRTDAKNRRVYIDRGHFRASSL